MCCGQKATNWLRLHVRSSEVTSYPKQSFIGEFSIAEYREAPWPSSRYLGCQLTNTAWVSAKCSREIFDSFKKCKCVQRFFFSRRGIQVCVSGDGRLQLFLLHTWPPTSTVGLRLPAKNPQGHPPAQTEAFWDSFLFASCSDMSQISSRVVLGWYRFRILWSDCYHWGESSMEGYMEAGWQYVIACVNVFVYIE